MMKTTLGKLSIPAAALAASMALAVPSASAEQGRNGGKYGGNHGDNCIRMNCSSSDYDRQVCRTPGRISDARIIRKISSSGCRQGSDWGMYEDAIWVRNGCRADFEVYLGGGRGYGRDYGRDDVLIGGKPGIRNRNDRQGVQYRTPNKARAISNCYAAMESSREMHKRNAISVQYVNEPRLVENPNGYVLRGPVRIQGPRGYSRVGTVCELDGNQVRRFYIDK